MSQTIAVTGASGFLGSHLLRRFLDSGHTVRALVRDRQKLRDLGLEAHVVVEGDIRDLAALEQVAEGADIFVHLVSNFRTAADPDEAYYQVNEQGTINAATAAEQAGVRRFVHCSTIGVHGHVKDAPANEQSPFNPGDLYQETKLLGERYVASLSGPMETVIIRPCSLYGPGDLRMLKMFRMLARRRFLMVGRGSSNFHAAYIDDVVDGFELAMTAPRADRQIYIIGGPEYVPLRDYVAAAARAVNAPAPWIEVPYAPMHAAAVVCEGLCKPFGLEPPLHRRRVRFYRNNRAFDLAKARTELGYEPRVGLEEGLERTVSWYRSSNLL